jgi:RNA polymerase sigma-70 factor (ECF subfamily)
VPAAVGEIHRYVARRLDVHAADDIAAETFTIAFRGRHRYDLARSNARPWLYGIATNLIGRHRRDERRKLRAQTAVARPGSFWRQRPARSVSAARSSASNSGMPRRS